MSRGRDRDNPGNSSHTPFGYAAGSTEQVLSVTDIISEGPIGGLVLGGKSVFLNDDPIFDDREVGFASTTGMTISGTTGSTAVTIKTSDAEVNFDYNPDETGETGKRFLLIHDLYSFNHTSSTSYTYSTDSAASAVGEQTGFKLKINGDFSTLPTTLIAPYGAIRVGNFSDKDGLAVVYNKTEDRFVEGTVSAISATQLEITLTVRNLADSPWLQTSDLKIRISELKKINSISGTTITLATAPDIAFSGKSFSISEPVYSNRNNPYAAQNRKYNSSGYQFRPGTIDQQPLNSLNGGVGSNSIALPVGSVSELNTGVPASIVVTGSEAAEIDSVHLIFRYNSGLYSLNTDDGEKGQAGAGYVIRLETMHASSPSAPTGTIVDQGFLQGNGYVTPTLRQQLLGIGAGKKGASIFVDGTLGGSATLNQTGSNIGLRAPMLSDGTIVDVLAEETPYFQHGGKFLSGVTFTHTIDLQDFQPYNGFKLTICRITNSESSTDDTKGRAHTTPGLTFIHEDNKKHQGIQSGGVSNAIGVIQDRVHFPYSAVANVTFNTKQFTNMPSRNYEVYGLKVKVPHNYTTREELGLIDTSDTLRGKEIVGYQPEGSRLYSGLFTGAFREEKVYTDNPAWVFYDMLTNNRYGAGEYVKEFDIDKFALYKIARYCDDLVADGKGGVEPRFRSNIYITKATDVYKVLKDMATVFRGMLYWMDGKLLTVIDEKKLPVYTFNRSNVIDGNFEYEYTGSKTRMNQMIVTWNNPKNEFKQEPLFVEDRQNIVKTGKIVKGKAVAFGCTSEGQAIRYGRWKLWTAINQTEVCAFETAINAAFLAPGDIINIQDNHDAGFSFGGRISSAVFSSGTTTITLDRDLAASRDGLTEAVIGPSGTYKLAVLLAEESFVAQELIEITGVTPDVTKGNAIARWRLHFPSTATSSMVRIVEDDTARNALTGNVDGFYAYQLNNRKLYVYGGSSYAEVTDGTTIQQLVQAAVNKHNIPVQIEHRTSTRVKEINCLQGNTSGSSISLGKVLTTNDLSESEATSFEAGKIWALKNDDEDVLGAYKQYKILAIVQENDNKYGITAVQYFDAKFDSIETNFTTAVDDPVFPEETDRPPMGAPLGLRASVFPHNTKPNQTVLLEWDLPANSQNVVSYEVTMDIVGKPKVVIVPTTSYEITDVPTGTYIFQVRAIDNRAQFSVPAVLEVEVSDSFSGSLPRIFGVLKGGITSAEEVITHDRVSSPVVQTIAFEKDPVFFFSPADTSNTSKQVPPSGTFSPLTFNILKDYANTSNFPWFTPENFCFGEAFVALTNYTNVVTRSLKLINRIEDQALGAVDYWFDQTKQIQKIYNKNEPTLNFPNDPDIWSALSGTVTIENNSSKVVGVGTAFTTELSITNVLKFSESFAAKITSIESDTVLFIDKAPVYKTAAITDATFISALNNIRYTASGGHNFVIGDDISISGLSPSTFNTPTPLSVQQKAKVVGVGGNTFDISNHTSSPASGVPTDATGTATTAIGPGSIVYKDQLSLDFSRDFIIGKIDGDGNYQSYLQLDAQIERIRGLVVDANIAVLNYPDGGATTTQSTTLPSTGIVLTATPVGYTNPEFRVQGTGFNISTSDSFVPDADDAFTEAGALARQVFDNSPIPYGTGVPLDFNVRVREKLDPTNTTKIIDKTFRITKVKDGASGSEGRTVAIEAEDNTILYDGGGETPEHSGTADVSGGTNNGIVVTATPFNFPTSPAPLFRFTQDTTVGTWSATNTLTLTVPDSDSGSFPKVVAVEVAVRPDGWDSMSTSDQQSTPQTSAKDSTLFVRVRKNAAGSPIISLPNNTVAIAANNDGTVATGTLTGTQTTMEVLIRGTRGTYVGGTDVTHGGFSGTLAPGQWYIPNAPVVTSNNITVGNITDTNNDEIIEIAAAQISGTAMDQNESITWTVRANNAGTIENIPVTQSIFKSLKGADGTTPTVEDGEDGFTTSAVNQSFIFVAGPTGVVSSNTFTSTLIVRRGDQNFTFAASGTAANTYSVTFSDIVNCNPSVSGGVLSIGSDSTLFAAGDRSAGFTVTIRDRADSNSATNLIDVIQFNFTKVKDAVRDGGTFIKQGASNASSFAGTLSSAAAQEAASFVMANSVDGFISQNDRVTLVNQGQGISATRVYTATTRRKINTLSSIGPNDFSSVVDTHISGSAILDGTLSASKIAANSVLGNNIIAQNTIQLSPGGAGGKIFGGNKESGFTDPDNGFHLDADGNVNIGNSTNFLKFEATGSNAGQLTLGGSAVIQGQKGDKGDDGNSVGSGSVDSNGNLTLNIVDGDGNPVSSVSVSGNIKGPQGNTGATGAAGATGSAFYVIEQSNLQAPSDNDIRDATGRSAPTAAIRGDVCIVVNTSVNPNTSKAYRFTTFWSEASLFITGDVIVNGSITALELATNSVNADKIQANAVTAGKVDSDAITARELAISEDNSPTNGIFFSSSPKRIEIRDGGKTRVAIGDLTGV